MKNKIVIFSILGLLILTSASAIGIGINNDDNYANVLLLGENTIYVDDSNTEGPWDGTQEHPFQTIKDGVVAANPGDTVFVYNGYYCENKLTIGKTIKLIGESKENTYITGETAHSVIDIPFRSNGTTVSGFTIENTGTEWDGDGICCGVTSCEHEIYDNILKGNYRAIYMSGNSDPDKITKIHDNIFIDNYNAIHFCLELSFEIYSNKFIDSGYLMHVTTSDYGFVYHNNFLTSDFVVDSHEHTSWHKDGVGNYWGPYYDVDEDQDGIWDNPKVVYGKTKDLYPATKAYGLVSNAPEFTYIEGPTQGKQNVHLYFRVKAVDPDGDMVKFIIDWGDGEVENHNFYESDTWNEFHHKYYKGGPKTIKVKSVDCFGYESEEWATHEIRISERSRLINNPLFNLLNRLIEKIPFLQNLLNL